MQLLTLLLLVMQLLPTRICHVRFLIEYETFMLCTWLLQTCLQLTLLLMMPRREPRGTYATRFPQWREVAQPGAAWRSLPQRAAACRSLAQLAAAWRSLARKFLAARAARIPSKFCLPKLENLQTCCWCQLANLLRVQTCKLANLLHPQLCKLANLLLSANLQTCNVCKLANLQTYS